MNSNFGTFEFPKKYNTNGLIKLGLNLKTHLVISTGLRYTSFSITVSIETYYNIYILVLDYTYSLLLALYLLLVLEGPLVKYHEV